VARVAERTAGGLPCVVGLDTELLGHFWHEGVDWLRAVIGACERRGLPLVPIEDALAEAPTEPAPDAPPPTSWGAGRDLRTWSGPAAGGLAWRQRAAELRTLAVGSPAPARALRELLALQSSDWAFLIANGTAGPYPAERAAGHEAALAAALKGACDPALRHLAPHLAGAAF
jgi:1,4-alpha-glucan branching enzyme